MTPFAWLGTFLLLPAVGAPLLARPSFRRFRPASRGALAAGVGAALVSFAMTAFALAGLAWGVVPVLLVAALLAAALSTLARSGALLGKAAPEPLGSAGTWAVVLSGICVVAVFVATLAGAATSVDLLFFWGPKAQQFAIARGVDGAFLRDPSHEYMHAYYPPLVTSLEALASMVAGRFSWTGATLTFPLVLGALALSLPGVLAGATRRAAAAAVSALTVGCLAVIGIRQNIAGNGDMPLFFFEALGMALLLRRDADDPGVQLVAGLLFAGAAAAKVEGLLVALAATAFFVLVRRPGAGEAVRASARLLVPAAVSLAAWFAFGATRHLFSVYSEYGPLFALHLEHWKSVASALPVTLARTGRGIPFAVPVICFFAAGRPERRALVPLGTAAALCAFLVFTYFHLVEDPSQWIAWSAARVLAPVPVFFALASACARPGAASSSSEPGP